MLSALLSKRGDQIAIHCARPTRAFLDRALREQEAQAILFLSFPLSHYRVAWLVSTAAVERAQLYRARSGSTGTSHATLFFYVSFLFMHEVAYSRASGAVI